MARSKLPALLIETADNYGASGVLSTAVGLARGLFNFSYKRYSAGHSQFVMARPAFAGAGIALAIWLGAQAGADEDECVGRRTQPGRKQQEPPVEGSFLLRPANWPRVPFKRLVRDRINAGLRRH